MVLSTEPSRGLYTIFDKVASKPGPVYEAVNDAVAMRAAKYALRNVDDITDYYVVYVGRIDDSCQLTLDEQRIIEVPVFNKEVDV